MNLSDNASSNLAWILANGSPLVHSMYSFPVFFTVFLESARTGVMLRTREDLGNRAERVRNLFVLLVCGGVVMESLIRLEDVFFPYIPIPWFEGAPHFESLYILMGFFGATAFTNGGYLPSWLLLVWARASDVSLTVVLCSATAFLVIFARSRVLRLLGALAITVALPLVQALALDASLFLNPRFVGSAWAGTNLRYLLAGLAWAYVVLWYLLAGFALFAVIASNRFGLLRLQRTTHKR